MAVLAAADMVTPVPMSQIPLNGLIDTDLKIHLRYPAQLALYFGGINGVAVIVARPVRNKLDLTPVGVIAGYKLIQPVTQGLHDLYIGSLVIAADIVDLTRYTAFQDSR
jgi:hypothetical protein